MKYLVSLLLGISTTVVSVATSSYSHIQEKHHVARDEDLAGYLGAFFLGNDPYVYFYLSNGNDATAFSALNNGDPVIKPTLGTGGVRDPSIVPGGGDEAGKKWYIIGTDLDIAKTTWAASERQGSLSILIWESTNLVNWTNERLIKVEEDTAGMVWAPDAIWDSEQEQYLVHWASRFYSANDSSHSGQSSNSKIRYAYTSDFETFSEPKDYIDYAPSDVIDLNILKLGNNAFARFLKNETATYVFSEISESGLFGKWTRPGGPDSVLRANVEGPASYWDNEVSGKAHLLLDYFGGNGYAPFVSTDVESGNWTADSTSNFPSGLRHGSVLQVNSAQYSRLQNL